MASSALCGLTHTQSFKRKIKLIQLKQSTHNQLKRQCTVSFEVVTTTEEKVTTDGRQSLLVVAVSLIHCSIVNPSDIRDPIICLLRTQHHSGQPGPGPLDPTQVHALNVCCTFWLATISESLIVHILWEPWELR